MTVLTDTWHGPMEVFAEDVGCSKCLVEYGEYSLLELAVMKSQVFHDSVVIDIGANIGAFTIPLAMECKKVYAVEPQEEVRRVLENNITMSGLTNIEVIPYGIGFKTEEMFYTTNTHGPGSVAMRTEGETKVKIVSLDSLGIEPDFIKIDVEGMEVEVLAGGMKMLQAKHPALFCEQWPGDNNLIRALTLLKYCSVPMGLPVYVPNNWKRCTTNHHPNMAHYMNLAIPWEGAIPDVSRSE
jgi:FkbM family methyltransferase